MWRSNCQQLGVKGTAAGRVNLVYKLLLALHLQQE